MRRRTWGRTRSRFILSIALSMPLTTDAMLPETWRMVTAVSTLLATASTRLERRRRLRDSVFFRMAFAAYILAPSLLPCCNAYTRGDKGAQHRVVDEPRSSGRTSKVKFRHVLRKKGGWRTFFSLAFSVPSSFCAFFA